jgi:Fur family ferric uptake transcriptional regulator
MPARPAARKSLFAEEQALFEAFLRARKLKYTGERKALVQAVFSAKHHFDADSLHMELRRKGGEVSRATVYRTLDLLVQCGLVRKQSLGDQHAHYEAVRGDEHHDHLICLNCQKVIEFFRPDLEALQDAICDEHRFRALHHSLQIFGLCADCAGHADEASLPARVSQIHT